MSSKPHLIAYQCLECGHYTISSNRDGVRCAKCRGYATPVGEATLAGKNKCMTISVSIEDMDIFKRTIRVLSAIADDKCTPDWIKEKVNRLVLEEL